MYYFIELAGSITNIALLSLFMSRLFVRNKIQSKWHYTFLTLLCTGQCVLSLFPNPPKSATQALASFAHKQSFLIKWISLNFIQSYIAASE